MVTRVVSLRNRESTVVCFAEATDQVVIITLYIIAAIKLTVGLLYYSPNTLPPSDADTFNNKGVLRHELHV